MIGRMVLADRACPLGFYFQGSISGHGCLLIFHLAGSYGIILRFCLKPLPQAFSPVALEMAPKSVRECYFQVCGLCLRCIRLPL